MLWGAYAFAQDVPWDRISDSTGLDSARRKAAETALRTARCYGGCEGTVLECLVAGDPEGIRLANFVARRAAAGRAVADIMKSIENRRLSALGKQACEVDLSGSSPSGDPQAPVCVVVFDDFECPYCKVASMGLREISLAMPDRVSVWLKHFPLSQHERAMPAAIAHLAAERQGFGWEMHDALFALGDDLGDSELEACAVAAGLDLDWYRRDIDSPELWEQVRAEKAEGVSCGVGMTPGILVNGKLYRGIKTKIELLDRIEEELDLLQRGD